MPDFRYTALDRAGKQVTGTLQGRDERDAAVKVRALGYYPVEVAGSNGRGNGRQVAAISGGKTRPIFENAGKPEAEGVKPTGKRVKRLQILLFTRQLADLVDAGLPLDRALSVLIEQSDDEALQTMVRRLQQDIRAGKPLSEALQNFPREFPSLYANMIHAGEVSGQLSQVMTRLADFLEKEALRRSQVIGALTYPAVLLGVAVFAVTFLLLFVIPRLKAVFEELGTGLPVPTRILLGTSGAIANYWYIMIGAGVAVYFLFKAWINTPLGRRSFDAFKLGLPLFGTLTKKMVMARFVRTLGTLLGGGVPILDSLEIAGSAVGNTIATDAIALTRDGVRQGETLAHSMEGNPVFLPLVIHMTAVGEETGRLPNMLIRTADTLDFDVDAGMRRLTTLVEPLVVLFMGGFVGFVVLSILMPIFEANTLVK
jgi:type II secretion system protein F